MQITIKSTRIIKEGFKKDGKTPYKWCSVMADDGSEKGTEYTTFDAGVLKHGAGAVIDIGDLETKDGKLSFKKVVKVISEGVTPVPSVPPGSVHAGMTPEAWAEKDRLERWSRECNTCFMGIPELIKSKPPAEGKAKDVYDVALDWALDHLKPGTAPKASKPKEAPTGKFANVGAFFTACLKEGVSRKMVLDKLKIDESMVSKIDTETAWQVIYDDIIKPSKEIEK